jgi:hypothetical protein
MDPIATPSKTISALESGSHEGKPGKVDRSDTATGDVLLDEWLTRPRQPIDVAGDALEGRLLEAIQAGRSVEFRYAAGSEPGATRRVRPENLFRAEGSSAVYLTAFCETRQATRTFRLDRIWLPGAGGLTQQIEIHHRRPRPRPHSPSLPAERRGGVPVRDDPLNLQPGCRCSGRSATAAELQLKHGEAGLLVEEGDPLDQSGAGGWRGRPQAGRQSGMPQAGGQAGSFRKFVCVMIVLRSRFPCGWR